MPNREKDDLFVNISMNLKMVHVLWFLCLGGIEKRRVLGDELTRYFLFMEQLEKRMLRDGYITEDEIRREYKKVNAHWMPIMHEQTRALIDLA